MSAPEARRPVVLVYSHRPEIRSEIIGAIGRRPAPDVGRIDFLECSGVAELLMAVDGHTADVLVLDGEAQPTGGIGLCRQIHQEAGEDGVPIPPIALVVARAADRWLSTWARADEVLIHPLDPVTTADSVAALLRRRLAVATTG